MCALSLVSAQTVTVVFHDHRSTVLGGEAMDQINALQIVPGAQCAHPVTLTGGLTQLQTLVQGYLEVVPLDDQHMMLVNEQGRLDKLPINTFASALASHTTPTVIVGVAVIVGYTPDGELASVAADLAERIT